MTAQHSLRLRPLKPRDEAEFRVGHEAMKADDFSFGLGLEDAGSWQKYLEDLDDCRLGRNLQPGRVPATLLIADVGGSIVGRTSIRHELNASLEQEGGHIGYGVLPEHRRRGYATEILRQSLVVARSVGVGRALVTCDDDNIGSITVIESCGGQLENIVPSTPPQPAIRRYWID